MDDDDDVDIGTLAPLDTSAVAFIKDMRFVLPICPSPISNCVKLTLLEQWNFPLSLIQLNQNGPLYILRGNRL